MLLKSSDLRCVLFVMLLYYCTSAVGQVILQSCTTGDLRLVEGIYHGRLEICWNGVWGTVCDDLWSNANSRVACRQLGFSGLDAREVPPPSIGKGPIYLDSTECIGIESKLYNCPHAAFDTPSDCTHYEDVGLQCFAPICKDGDLRLFGGLTNTIGGVEMCIQEQWFTLAGGAGVWGIEETNVACKQLGFSDVGNSVAAAEFGPAPSVIVIRLECEGTENNVIECNISKHIEALEYAAIQCKDRECTDGEVDLVPPPSLINWSRVLLCQDGHWGAVCTRDWSPEDAGVVCSQKGYPRQKALSGSLTKNVSLAVHADRVNCIGAENELRECDYTHTTSCVDSSKDAALKCQRRLCEDGDIRLVTGVRGNPLEGRVEVCWRSGWGTVCGDSFGEAEASVACRQLGYSKYGGQPIACPWFTSGVGSITLADISCNDNALRLIDCNHLPVGTANCNHLQDLGIRCNPRVCEEGAIRLVDGDTTVNGRVELCKSEQWFSICDNGWSHNEATVACTQLGLRTTNALAHMGSHFGSPTGHVMRPLRCSGRELSLLECSTTEVLGCSHDNTAGVTCQDDTINIFPTEVTFSTSILRFLTPTSSAEPEPIPLTD